MTVIKSLREFVQGLTPETRGKIADPGEHLKRLGLAYVDRSGTATFYESRKKRAYALNTGEFQIFRR